MTDQLSGSPPYTIDGVKFTCWITDRTHMPGSSRYEWRSPNRRIRVGKNLGGNGCWVTIDGVPVKGFFPLLSAAMRAGVQTGQRRRAA